MIDIIIPTGARPALLKIAVESARVAGTGVQVLVVDRSPTTQNEKICINYGAKYLALGNSASPSVARNAGAQTTQGEFIAFLDDDDLLLAGSLDRLRKKLESYPDAALSYGKILVGDVNATPTGKLFPERQLEGDLFWPLLERNLIMIHAALIRRDCFQQVGGFQTEISRNEDWDLWIRLAERWPIVALTAPVGVVRTGHSQHSADREKMSEEARKLFNGWMEFPRARAASKAQRAKVTRSFLYWQAWALASQAVERLKTNKGRAVAAPLIAALKLSVAGTVSRMFAAIWNALKLNRFTRSSDQ